MTNSRIKKPTLIIATPKQSFAIVEAVFGFVLLLALFYPYSFNTILPEATRKLLLLFSIIISLWAMLLYTFFDRLDKIGVALLGYFFFFAVPVFLYDGYFKLVFFTSADISIVRTLGMCAFASLLMHNEPKKFCDYMLLYLAVLITVNLATIIVFPGGMYSTGHEENYFLGYDNTHCVVFYLALCIAFARDRMMSGTMKISPLTWYLIIIINISVFICKSSTSIVQVVLFDVLFIFAKMLHVMRIYNAKVVVAANLLFSWFLTTIFTKKGNRLIGFIAENLLHKDATFTERTVIWENASAYIKKRLLFGYGWDGNAGKRLGGFYHAHNQYLTDLYYGGIFLLLCLIVLLIVVSRKLDNYKADPLHSYFLCIMFVTVLHWNVESMHLPMQLVTLVVIYNIDVFVNNRLRDDRCPSIYHNNNGGIINA